MRKRVIITSGPSGTYEILLTQDIPHTIARSIAISKLDYCNAILHGSPKSSTAVLQRNHCISTVEVHEYHSATEVIALAANLTDITVRASVRNL